MKRCLFMAQIILCDVLLCTAVIREKEVAVFYKIRPLIVEKHHMDEAQSYIKMLIIDQQILLLNR